MCQNPASLYAATALHVGKQDGQKCPYPRSDKHSNKIRDPKLNFLFSTTHKIYDDQNNGSERLRICQNEAGKFSKALAKQFGYLVESLQTGKICDLEENREGS
jgi:hypothetical protein